MRRHALGRVTELRMMTVEEAFTRRHQMLEQMPAIGHLDGVRGSLPHPVGIGSRAVSADELDAWM